LYRPPEESSSPLIEADGLLSTFVQHAIGVTSILRLAYRRRWSAWIRRFGVQLVARRQERVKAILHVLDERTHILDLPRQGFAAKPDLGPNLPEVQFADRRSALTHYRR
jgi:hypothetical protein